MSFNYPYNRHDASSNSWGLKSQALDHTLPDGNENMALLLLLLLLQSPGLMPGFRNPWYAGLLGMKPNHQLSTQQMALLGSRKQSFANQLPTTYENANQQSSSQAYIHPPTRSDNPFNHYYTNQEVLLNQFPDRRMSAAVDGSMFNPYNNPFQGDAVAAAAAPGQILPPHLAPGQFPSASATAPRPPVGRRSSVAIGASAYQQSSLASQYLNARVGQSPSATPYYSAPVPQLPIRRVPRAIRVNSKSDLNPRTHHQPKYRRRSVNLMHILPVNALSVYLTELYAMCQPQKFRYLKTTNPKRVLTKPSEPKFNNGCDNEDSDYILYVNDILGQEEGRKYVFLDLLGSGTFGQVVKCQNLANQLMVAVKVVKSKPAYLNQSISEVKLLEFLNQNSRSNSFIRLLDTFMHREHLCLVFEILALNLYELIKQNQFHGLSMKLVKSLTRQLLDACAQLKNFQVIHCDLKPENILLCQPDKPEIKVIDFGSACFTRRTIYSYIQSRFYRSPEVILGLPYTELIDMWSLGCIVGELFLGLPMFPGSLEYNQIFKIVDMLGNPPRHMIEVGRNSLNYFNKIPAADPSAKATYKLKSHEEYLEFVRSSNGREDLSKAEQPNKNYFNHKLLKEIIMNYKMPSRKMTQIMIDKEYKDRGLLVDFLTKVLNLNPLERLTPLEALKHPFVCDSPPPLKESSTSLLLSNSAANDPLKMEVV